MIEESKLIYWFAVKASQRISGPRKHSPFIRALVKVRYLNGLKIVISFANICKDVDCWTRRVTSQQHLCKQQLFLCNKNRDYSHV